MVWGKVIFLGTVILLSMVNVRVFAQAPDTLWTRTYGGTNEDVGLSVQQTSDGGYIVAGYTRSSGSVRDFYLIKIDAIGNTQWTKTYGSLSSDDWAQDVIQSPDDGYVIVGSTDITSSWGDERLYIVRTDSLGDTVWTYHTTGSDYEQYGFSVDLTFDNMYVIAGLIRSPPLYDGFIQKRDSLGNRVWNYYVGASYTDISLFSVYQTWDSGFIAVGEAWDWATQRLQGFVTKRDPSGWYVWSTYYGNSSSEDCVGNDVAERSDHGYIVTGFKNNVPLVVSMNASGNIVWADTFDAGGYSIKRTSDECYVVAGRSVSLSQGSLIKINAVGGVLWAANYGGDCFYSVDVCSDGGFILAGTKNNDVYVVKTAPEPGIEESQITSLPLTDLDIFPNPFSDRIDIKFSIGQGAEYVELNIYDATGRIVKQFDYKTIRLSDHVSWDGRDNAGKKVASGVYFLQFEMGDNKATKKLLLIR